MAANARITASTLPSSSLLHQRIGAKDYLDCFTVAANVAPRPAAEIITDFPNWARAFLSIRRIVTSPFGLLNDGPKADDKVGIFPIEIETENELIAGFNDSHLDFRVSVLSQNGQVHLATWVHTHNLFGKLYLATILPFHILVARNALARLRDQYG